MVPGLESAVRSVCISPEFQIVIPEGIREELRLVPGQRVHVVVVDERIELIPLRPATELRGFLEGIDTGDAREADRI